MMRAGSWLMLSGGLALGAGTAALALTTQTAAVSSLALVPPVAFATLAVAALLRAPLPFMLDLPLNPCLGAIAGRGRRPGRGAAGDDAARAGRSEGDPASGPTPAPPPAQPIITFTAFPVVSVPDEKPVAAVVVEPTFRVGERRSVAADGVDWGRIAPAMLARLDATLLDRAAAFAASCDEGGHRETVIVSVAASSLRQRAFAARLGRLLDRDRSERPRLLVLARGGPDDLAPLLALPRSWRDSLGLHLDLALTDEDEIERCLGAGLGCLQVDAGLLQGGSAAAELTARLVARFAEGNVPVVVSGIVDDGLMRRLRAYPPLFARGPLFGPLRALAA